MEAEHRIVIVGGGFGGLYAARALKRAPAEITLLDRRNYHLFQPLLYQVATGFLAPSDVASPLRAILMRQRNTRVLLAEVTDVDVKAKQVVTEDGRLHYDTLIMAAGANHSYFGHEDWRPFAPGLKSVESALDVRRRVFLAFERAEKATDSEARRKWLTFVIVGGGPTGVEVAGALGETVLHTLRSDYRRVKPADVRILLLQRGQRILPTYAPQLSAKAIHPLERLGVTVRTGNSVTGVARDSVVVEAAGREPETIPAGTILWAAGVEASPLGRSLASQTGAKTDHNGRLRVEPDLTLPGHPEIFVIGDLADFSHQTGKPLPGVAQPAMQEGAYAARLIQARLRGRSLPPFHYIDLGMLATIGRGSAIADLKWIRFTGIPGKLIWIFVHIWQITLAENKALVFVQWAWNFLTMSQRARIIIGPPRTTAAKPSDAPAKS